jgi:hypothetical protein
MDIRLISKKAIEELSRKNLLDIYTPARVTPADDDTTKYQMSVEGGKFKAEILGGFTAVQKQLIQSVRGLTNKDMSKVKVHSNGHKFLRYVTNCMAAENLNEILSMYRN